MKCDLRSEYVREFRKSLQVFLGVGLLAESVTKKKLIEYQVNGRIYIRAENGMSLHVFFCVNAFADLPPLALIDAQDRCQLIRRERAGLRHKGVHIRSLPFAPQLPQT